MHYDRNSSAARTAASAALSAELRVPLGRLITSGGRSSTTNTSRRADERTGWLVKNNDPSLIEPIAGAG